MNNLIFETANYTEYEKKILRTMIDKIFPLISHECDFNECKKCSIKHLCNDTGNALKMLSENCFILKF
jgi:hypothetical protein